MFNDLKTSFENLLKNCSHITTSHGTHIVFPEKLFDQFQKEFDICFTEPEEDVEWQQWVAMEGGGCCGGGCHDADDDDNDTGCGGCGGC